MLSAQILFVEANTSSGQEEAEQAKLPIQSYLASKTEQ